jgi:hypothetical protein
MQRVPAGAGPVTVQVLRPVHDPVRLVAPARTAAPPWAPSAPLRIALVANGKPNSVELLDALALEIRRALPAAGVEVRRYRKGSVSVAPDPADVEEIAQWATAVIAALGD